MEEHSIIPRDLELVIPGHIGFFEVLIVVSFLIHILFVNITVGSSILAVFKELQGIVKKNRIADALAEQMATHTSIMKSIAVVMGIAPLLLISVIYTQYFYASTNLIGKAWLSLIVLLIISFLLLYLYKFSWERLATGSKKWLHLFIGAAGSLVLLCVPLIFIVNVVSMLYPEMWAGANGFFHSLFYYPQIWPRYFHFILATFAVTGIYLYFWNGLLQRKQLKNSVVSGEEEQFALHKEVYRQGKHLGVLTTIWTTVLQFGAGFLLLFSFEKDIMLLYMGGDALLTGLLVASLLLTVLLLISLFMLMKTDIRKYFVLTLITFVLVLGVMGWMRHELRENHLKQYIEENPRTTMIDS